MAEKLSELERWLQHMQTEGERDSSGRFTVDAGNRLERYRTMLGLNPSLPWLQLTQWAHRHKASAITLRVTRDEIHWMAHGLSDPGDWGERLTSQAEDPLLLLLHAVAPEAIRFVWMSGDQGWTWSWPGDGAIQSHSSTGNGDLMVSLRVQLTPVRRRDLISEFTARTHFAPIPMHIDGRPHPSRLDLTSAGSRSFGVAVDLVSQFTQDEQDYFAAVPPAFHQARMTLVNAKMAGPGPSSGADQESGPQVACYHLHHDDLGYDVESDRSSHIDLGKAGLKNSLAFLAPARSWVNLALFGFQLLSQTIRPLRARSLYLLSADPDKGNVYVLPVREGVSLNPIQLPGARRGSTTISICPANLQTDLSGLKLVEDPACRAWLQKVVDASRRCL